ncbi:MAG: phosphoenolpyruvate synthase [Bradyrhizobiaceae bacterium]|nr:phosphoenolpyruvate synthase [Bradyrhizobiaceae bacterium]
MKKMQPVLWFADIGLGDRLSVGGKGASLGELTRAGIRVPPGFVVPTSAFEVSLESLDASGEIRRTVAALNHDDVSSVAAAAEKIRARIRSAPLPGDLEAGIARAYGELCRGQADAPVAVRSSATSEDSEEASFAGLQDTYLWVRGERGVLDHVRQCWASLYNTESLTYRLRLGLPEENIAMAVVVQRMVPASASGVMFTRSPTTGDRSTIVIEACWGLGSCLVSGEVTPDRFIVSKVTGDISAKTISSKTLRHVPDPVRGGVRDEPVPDELQAAASVSDDIIAELVAVGKTIERHYGRPQDIEWAVSDDAPGTNIFILQSRPETVWAARDAQPIAKPAASALEHVFAALGHRKS